jgi:hypothetical protein
MVTHATRKRTVVYEVRAENLIKRRTGATSQLNYARESEKRRSYC